MIWSGADQCLIDVKGDWPLGSRGPRQSAVFRERAPLSLAVWIAGATAIGFTAVIVHRIGWWAVGAVIADFDLTWVLVTMALTVASALARAVAWKAIADAALPECQVRHRDVMTASMIGTLMSATLPARLGEPARAVALARRIGRIRETLPVIIGTLVSQSALNVLALVLLGGFTLARTGLFGLSLDKLLAPSLVPVAVILGIVTLAVRTNRSGLVTRVWDTVVRVRSGFAMFGKLRCGLIATTAQLGAWALHLLAYYALFAAIGLDATVGMGAAAVVLFAVNVSAVVPATPSNIGIFQLAIVTVLTTGFHVHPSTAFAYGVVLQAIEILTAVIMGVPALGYEGVTWSDMRRRIAAAAPAELPRRVWRPLWTRHRSGDRMPEEEQGGEHRLSGTERHGDRPQPPLRKT
ncbi:MAG: lysylphosphatidylglycerol synthase transmembrane domain-containing protein [Pseudonocardiaceae bacterium]